MRKQEISEIKKLFTPGNCSITRICGCYVECGENKKQNGTRRFWHYRRMNCTNILRFCVKVCLAL